MIKNNNLQAEEPAGTARPSRSETPKRILVVDDEPLLRQIYTEMLSHGDYTVATAEDGAAAWAALQVNDYDLLITDNNMPKVTGVDLLKRVYAACMRLPIIMATGTYPDEEFIRHPWLQPAAMLLKPCSMAEILEAVKKVLCLKNDVGWRSEAGGSVA